ncbi:CASP-like protein 4B1 [Sesamum angolense]|uniref:CASP-like protein n=1 Tax=Sesamum angolense TaxID=2727404 RepID=A0AAE2BSE7_9LAMI|nr:CASP-like protein 4B1 [Sesamum angolense]
MPNSDDSNPQKATPSAPAAIDVESRAAGGGGVSNIVSRWKREDLLKRSSIASRGFGFVFSLLAFIIMATNKHGDWKDFDKYEEYRHTFLLYVLAIAILATLYAGLQALRQIHELSTDREMFSRQNLALVDFFGDQIVAYLLISAGSSAVPLTNRMREGADNVFTDASASAISMEFLAFFSLALSALISGYKLSNQSYI